MIPPVPPMLGPDEAAPDFRWLPPATVMLGSLVTIVPVVATFPILPPFGLMLLLAWRLRRPELFAPWGALPLGLWDDLLSGQPLGSATLLWTLCFFALDVVDLRLVWRDFVQDWAIAAGLIAGCLVLGRLVATPLAAHVDGVVLIQAIASILLFPLAVALVDRLEGKARP